MELFTDNEGVAQLERKMPFYAWTDEALEYELVESDGQDNNNKIEVTENFRYDGDNVYLITSASDARLIKG